MENREHRARPDRDRAEHPLAFDVNCHLDPQREFRATAFRAGAVDLHEHVAIVRDWDAPARERERRLRRRRRRSPKPSGQLCARRRFPRRRAGRRSRRGTGLQGLVYSWREVGRSGLDEFCFGFGNLPVVERGFEAARRESDFVPAALKSTDRVCAARFTASARDEFRLAFGVSSQRTDDRFIDGNAGRAAGHDACNFRARREFCVDVEVIFSAVTATLVALLSSYLPSLRDVVQLAQRHREEPDVIAPRVQARDFVFAPRARLGAAKGVFPTPRRRRLGVRLRKGRENLIQSHSPTFTIGSNTSKVVCCVSCQASDSDALLHIAAPGTQPDVF